ncbi:MAG: hypothetical protein JEZ00_10915 [Anaerolineaceae bacterium]|nr:hypothetical protein [Anaerolineaceae bacterium]
MKNAIFEKHCFEPTKSAFSELQRFQNNLKVKLNQLAIGKEVGCVNLYYDKEGSTLVSLSMRKLDHSVIDFSLEECVEITTIDDYVRIMQYQKLIS